MQIQVSQSLVIVLPLVALADLDFHLPPWPTRTRHLAFEANWEQAALIRARLEEQAAGAVEPLMNVVSQVSLDDILKDDSE